MLKNTSAAFVLSILTWIIYENLAQGLKNGTIIVRRNSGEIGKMHTALVGLYWVCDTQTPMGGICHLFQAVPNGQNVTASISYRGYVHVLFCRYYWS